MIRGAGPQALRDLAAVDLRDVTRGGNDRHHHRAVKMLVPGVAQNTQPLQPAADLRPLNARGRRQSISKGPIRKAYLERFDGFGGADAASFEVVERLRARE